jgi:peptidoglycan-associated lipoprotein
MANCVTSNLAMNTSMSRPATSLFVLRAATKLLGAMTVLWALGTGCGPSYPDCDDDENCKSHNEVCVDKKCVQCKDDTQCNKVDACQACTASHTCKAKTGCCKGDLDCPGGKCWKEAQAQTGKCGGACQADADCPAGQRCANGSCVPAWECTDDSKCPAGQRCINNKCVAAACEIKPVLFDFNEFAIRLDQEQVVQANADCIKEQGKRYQIEGHCDERGDAEYNLALGNRRANAVLKQYKQRGVVDGNLSVISYGKERPTCTEHTDSCWSKNRRSETVEK